MSETPEIYIIDGHNLLYKAHFAFIRQPLINTRGKDVSVTYGFTRMLMGLLEGHKPEYLVIAFDRKAPTFRHELYARYKLNRPPMPAPIADNIQNVKTIVDALGINILEQDGYEADDFLGSVVHTFRNTGVRLILVTGDKDMLQLVSDDVTVLVARKGLSDFTEFRREQVIGKYGVPPEKMVDFFSIAGDTSDNVPGITGIGPKGAAKLLSQFDSLEAILSRSNEIESDSVRKKVEENREFALLSKKLIELKIKPDVPDSLDWYRIRSRDEVELRRLFKELEFHSMIEAMGPERIDAENRDYQVLTDRSSLLELSRRLRSSKVMAFDVETTSEDPLQAKLVGISISNRSNEAFYIPVGHQTGASQVDMEEVRRILLPVLTDPSIAKIGQNIKYDWIVARRHGLDLKGVSFDTMIASYLRNPGRRQHNLDSLCMEYLNLQKIPTDSLIGKKTGIPTMDLVEIDKVADYACEDADTTFRLWGVLGKKLKEEGFDDLMNRIEMPLIEVLVDMEMSGIRIDGDMLRALSGKTENSISRVTEEIHILAGETFNINSPRQLSDILFGKLQYPAKGIKKIQSGYSTAENELRKLVSLGGMFSELPTKILEFRTLTKLKNTYLDTLPGMIHPLTGRVHTSFNQTVTETGRLSSSNPNLQNIPVRTELGREIRRAFIPAEGNVLISADYSQMELRILAHITEDESLIAAFEADRDIHAATASTLFNVPENAVTAEQRRRAKMVNFGIDYGMTPYGLSERLGIPMPEARLYISKYLDHFRGVRSYIGSIEKHVESHGWVETLSGRRRYIHTISDDRRQVREAALRQAINMPIQGTAADIIKIAMTAIHHEFKRLNIQSLMVLQVHDELLFDTLPREEETVKNIIRTGMENAWKLRVPLKVDIRSGSNWAEIH
ncbi:DNA polymerase I [bacterium]|nr:DNA polymerase I [candidate division CSSED10-310 bacterium]